jgi:hypothetical protein
MAFSYGTNNDGKFELIGRKRMVTGTFANTSTAADGYISTGLREIEVFGIQCFAEGNTVPTIAYPKIAAFPVQAEGLTVRAAADTEGVWYAIGN